jgi:hypothetical protein
MAKKADKGNYLTLADVRVSYDKKTDSIHLTSKDEELPKDKSFRVTLNKGTEAESGIRQVLAKHGMIPSSKVDWLPIGIKYSDRDFSMDRWDDIPLGVVGSGAEIRWETRIEPNLSIAGMNGSGRLAIQKNVISHCRRFSDNWDLYGIDLRGSELRQTAAKGVFKSVAKTYEEAYKLLTEVHAEIERRYAMMLSQDVVDYKDLHLGLIAPLKSIMVIFDDTSLVTDPEGDLKEISSNLQNGQRYYVQSDRFYINAIKNTLEWIARRGRVTGINMSLGLITDTNKKTNLALPPAQMSLSISMGRTTAKISNAVLGSKAGTSVPSIPGRGYYTSYGLGTNFQSYLPDGA